MVDKPTIAIIGAGAAGLCMAMQLRRAGIHSFTLFEKAATLGGTWRDNVYPGCGCDVPSHLYRFSFEPNPSWTRKYALQHEIIAYLEHCARRYALLERTRFDTEIAALRYRAERATWELETTTGERFEADVVVTGTGQLSRPSVPAIPGSDTFEGAAFHSARWQRDAPIDDARVAVIGNAASAIQLVPPVAQRARSLRIFQRSANWIMGKPDRAYSALERRLFRRLPWLATLHRLELYWLLEARLFGFTDGSLAQRVAERIARRELARVRDPELRRKLTPDYPIGCKRILISNDYYDAVQRPNVAVVDRAVERITPRGLVTSDGALHEADTIVYATGFESTRFLAPMRIEGREGRSLSDAWEHGAEAYLGLTVAGFPNLFLLYGPNTNLGHSSILFMIECQTRYVLSCLRLLAHRGARALEVSEGAMRRYNEELQAELRRTVWGAGCNNWYRDASGKITNNWASFTTAYWWQTRRPDVAAYVFR